MKAKVNGSKKDINIDISIENNLMSKNKTVAPDPESTQDTPIQKLKNSSLHKYNPDLPRMVNEYYGVMASKQLYDFTSSRPAPLNLNQYFPSVEANRPQVQTPSIIHPQEDEETDIFEDPQGENEDVSFFNTMDIPHVDFVNGRIKFNIFAPDDISVDMIKSSALNAGQESYLKAHIPKNEKGNRKTAIDRIKGGHRIQTKTIVKYNLGAYVRDINPVYWSEITGVNEPMGA